MIKIIDNNTIKKTAGVLFLFCSFYASAQNATLLTLDSCYALARQNYPLIKQEGLIEKSKEYNVENAGKAYLPQFSINAQATDQSAVTSFPFTSIDIPHIIDINIPTQYKDQYNIHGEVDQTIYDGGTIKQQKQAVETNADISEKNLEVQLYALKDRVNQVFFGALLIDEQLKQNDLLKKDIQNSIDKMQEAVNNGTALKSNVDELQAELLQQDQNAINLKANRTAYINMLALLVNKSLTDSVLLQTPHIIKVSDSINRPELSFYDFQKRSDDVQDKILNAQNRPKLSFFFQGGYARPGLNAFDVNFEWYYIGGFRLSWNFGGYYTLNNQRQLLNIDRETADINKETFLLNTRITLKQQSTEITRLEDMMNKDDEIIAKRTAIKEESQAQMENGVVTVHEYVGELNAENEAKENLLLHKVQLLQAQYDYKNTSGN